MPTAIFVRIRERDEVGVEVARTYEHPIASIKSTDATPSGLLIEFNDGTQVCYWVPFIEQTYTA